MKISTARVKQYNATYKHILIVDGVPVCMARSRHTLNDCIGYLMNGTPLLSDGKIMKILDKVRHESEGQNDND